MDSRLEQEQVDDGAMDGGGQVCVGGVDDTHDIQRQPTRDTRSELSNINDNRK